MRKLTRRQSYYFLLIGSLMILGVGMLISISLGAKQISISDLLKSLTTGIKDINYEIIFSVRLPRAICAILVGGYLALSGAIMQGVTRNPIAEPSVMGITQGATFMIALAFVLQKVSPGLSFSYLNLMLFAFLGASISGTLVYVVSSRGRGKVDPVKLALAGTALGTLLISLASGMAIINNLSQQLGFWISGGLTGANWQHVKILLGIGFVGCTLSMLLAPRLTILSLGEDVAIGLGEKTNRIRLIALLLVVLLTGASVAVAGNIVFVGLVVPQIVKSLVGVDYKYILPCSFTVGAVFLTFGDILARLINPPFESPIGSLTALIGVPVFIYLIRKERAYE